VRYSLGKSLFTPLASWWFMSTLFLFDVNQNIVG
jgi:hypothetical protein